VFELNGDPLALPTQLRQHHHSDYAFLHLVYGQIEQTEMVLTPKTDGFCKRCHIVFAANRPHHDPHHHYRDTYHQIHPTIPMEGSEDPPTTPDPPIAHCLIKVKSHQIKANTMDISHTQPYPAFALANHWVDQLTNKPNPTSHHSDHPPPPLPPPQPIHTPLLLSGHIFFHGNTYIDTDAPSFIQTQYHKELLHRMRRLPSMGWIANDGQQSTDPTHALHSLFTLPSILTHTTLNMALLSHLRLQKCSIPGWHPH
jgi:hypothetical protein